MDPTTTFCPNRHCPARGQTAGAILVSIHGRNCIGFASESRGWVGTLGASAGKRLFETRDGGTTWHPVANLPPLAPSWVCGLSVVNAAVVYASGTNEGRVEHRRAQP